MFEIRNRIKRKLLSLAIMAGSFFVAVAAAPEYGYFDFLKAGSYALNRGMPQLAADFMDHALENTPRDSLEDQILIHEYLREACLRTRDLDAALDHARKCIELLMSVKDSVGNRYFAEYYGDLANVYAERKDSLNVRKTMEEGGVFLKERGAHNLHLRIMYNKFGVVCGKMGWNSEAEAYYSIGKSYMKRYQPCDETLLQLNLYGNILYANGKYDKAYDIYGEQQKTALALHGEDSRQYRWASIIMASMEAYRGNIEAGIQFCMDNTRWYRGKMLEGLLSTASAERPEYLSDYIEVVRNSIPFCVAAGSREDEFTRAAYQGLLDTKGLLLQADRSAMSLIRSRGTDAQNTLLDESIAVSRHLSEMHSSGSDDYDAMLLLFNRRLELDRQVARTAAVLNDGGDIPSVDIAAVADGLAKGEVLLDFYDFKPASKPRQYVCFEMRRGWSNPRLHYLCNGSELDSLLRLEKGDISRLYDGETGAALASIVGRRIKEISKGAKCIYYVPSGFFHKLSIEAIPDGKGVLSDRFDLRRLSSARELTGPAPEPTYTSARLYGGIDYGAGGGVAENRFVEAAALDSLPGTLREVENIGAIMSRMPRASIVKGKEATKEGFLAMSGLSPDILHVATHGYFYSSDDADRPLPLSGYRNAMSLTGLMLSDANEGWLGRDYGRGMLSAAEISGCDLSRTSLVCLAACRSGQGEVSAEGIYGLQRAFKMAGAGSLLVSLWDVNDEAGSRFMTEFYTGLIEGSGDIREAFVQARRKVRAEYPDPFYWAGYVLID